MDANYKNILDELDRLKDRLDSVAQNQMDLKKEMRMIFADISHFENMVIKILDNSSHKKSVKEFQH